MAQANDHIFGHGRFQCLGKSVAQIELAKTVFEMMRNFDLALQNPRRPWKTRNVVGIFVIEDLWVQVRDRVL
ncbi:Cytochrome P450 monooxygenase lolP1 [Cladobotryum mycophilum]|uniref:Cytochrome P450 monooxygenase lolP1 n=1 Tax=Cladobotryum mycophilum TaxID=491253 RepID=A0ABR0SRF5_9HYPO